MPQIPAAKQVNGAQGAPSLYGATQTNNAIPFQERLMKLFNPQDFVRIKNIHDQPVYWQYLPSHAEQITNTPDGMQKMVQRQLPEQWVIEPGESEVLIGASAYMALDVMYKTVTAARTLKRTGTDASFQDGAHVPRNFNFADGGAQEEFIKQAYQGKETPTFSFPSQVEAVSHETAPTTIKSMAEINSEKEKELSGGKTATKA